MPSDSMPVNGHAARLAGFLRRNRLVSLVLLDASAWFIAMFVATSLRLEELSTAAAVSVTDAGGSVPLWGVVEVAGIAAIVHLALAWFLRLHHGRSSLGSIDELFLLLGTVATAGAVITVVNLVTPTVMVPRSAPVIATFLMFCLSMWIRVGWRLAVVTMPGREDRPSATRVIIVGAGEGGCQLVSSMQNDPQRQWKPVAFVDDDPRKKHFRHRGVAVLGRLDQVSSVADRLGATGIVIAIPSADSALISRVSDDAIARGLSVKILPGIEQLLDGVSHRSVRDLEPSDLLGRHQIETDVESIVAYLAGKRVLVTGAGGSIGSEICRQVSRHSPAAVAFLERDESALHRLVLSLDGRADLESPSIVLADLRDEVRIDEVFASFKPDIVFHAAALKHVNVLENHAGEALQTNVWGTLTLLEAAQRHGVERFVNISTDKAADPINVLGHSKRLAERLTAHRAAVADGTYISVRFGNVFGTNGSVITTFASQIEAGEPLTVTHPDVTRYFMTVSEAVQLVIQAAAIGSDGDALVLEMGDPVRIQDVAERMIALSGRDVPIVYTGLKPGEKLHEDLFGVAEKDHRPRHPMVSHVSVPPVTPRECLALRRTGPNRVVADELARLALSDTSAVSI